MDLKSAGKVLFDRFTTQATLGKGATRKDIPEFEDTQRNVALAQSMTALEALDDKPGVDKDDHRKDHLRLDAAVVADTQLKAQMDDLELSKPLMTPEDFDSAKQQLEAMAAETKANGGEVFIDIQRNEKALEKITTIETTGKAPDIEYVYNSLSATLTVSVEPDGAGFKASAQALLVGGKSFEETLQGDWNLLQGS